MHSKKVKKQFTLAPERVLPAMNKETGRVLQPLLSLGFGQNVPDSGTGWSEDGGADWIARFASSPAGFREVRAERRMERRLLTNGHRMLTNSFKNMLGPVWLERSAS
jgi:hypothetical protein